jgi:hypothetical protein
MRGRSKQDAGVLPAPPDVSVVLRIEILQSARDSVEDRVVYIKLDEHKTQIRWQYRLLMIQVKALLMSI